MSKALICGRDTGVPCIPLKLPAKAGEFYEIMSKALICGRDTGVPCIPLKLPAKAGEFYPV